MNLTATLFLVALSLCACSQQTTNPSGNELRSQTATDTSLASPNSVFVSTVDIGDYIAKDSSSKKYCHNYWAKDGDACELTQVDAVKYCELQGKHLPSAREYAEYAMSRGAIGIKETNFPNIPLRNVDKRVNDEWGQMYNSGYPPIFHYIGNAFEVGAVYFYYNFVGYRRPLPEAYCSEWTSTLNPNAGPYAYLFDSNTGNLESASSNIYNSTSKARCAPGPEILETYIEPLPFPYPPLPNPQFSDILRGADGIPQALTFKEATKYCGTQGKRLPTAKEIAIWSTKYGAKGVSERGYETSTPSHFWVFTFNDPNDEEDDFLYSSEGYIAQEPKFIYRSVWSSSRSNVKKIADSTRMIFLLPVGLFYTTPEEDRSGVVCVDGP